MTFQEALKIAKSTDPLLHCGVNKDNYKYVGCIIEALEKQIPKNVIIYKGEDWYGSSEYSACPACRREVKREMNKYGEIDSDSYCRACGQALSWKEQYI